MWHYCIIRKYRYTKRENKKPIKQNLPIDPLNFLDIFSQNFSKKVLLTKIDHFIY